MLGSSNKMVIKKPLNLLIINNEPNDLLTCANIELNKKYFIYQHNNPFLFNPELDNVNFYQRTYKLKPILR